VSRRLCDWTCVVWLRFRPSHLFYCKSTALCVSPCNFITYSLRCTLLQHNSSPCTKRSYTTVKNKRHNTTALFRLSPRFFHITYLLSYPITHDTQYYCIQRAITSVDISTHQPTYAIKHKPYNTIHGKHQTATCFGTGFPSSDRHQNKGIQVPFAFIHGLDCWKCMFL